MVSVKTLLQPHHRLAFLEAGLASVAEVLLEATSGRNPLPLQQLLPRPSPAEPAFLGQDPPSILLHLAALQAGKVPRPPLLAPGLV